MKEPKHPGKAPSRPKKPQEPASYSYGTICISPFSFGDYLPELQRKGMSSKHIAKLFVKLYDDALGYAEEDMVEELNTSDSQLDYRAPKKPFEDVNDCIERADEFIECMCQRMYPADIWHVIGESSFSIQDLIDRLPEGVSLKDVTIDSDHYWDMTFVTASYKLPLADVKKRQKKYQEEFDQYQKDLEEYKKLSAEHKKKMTVYKQQKTKFDNLLAQKIEQMKQEGIK